MVGAPEFEVINFVFFGVWTSVSGIPYKANRDLKDWNKYNLCEGWPEYTDITIASDPPYTLYTDKLCLLCLRKSS